LRLLRETDHPQARFVWAIFRDMFHYIAIHLGDVAQTARDIDFALRWGFGWETGPFETWQSAGWQRVAEWVSQDIERGEALCKAPLPEWVLKGPVPKAGGVHTPQGSWNATQARFEPRIELPVYAKQLFRAPLAGEGVATAEEAGETIFSDESCRLWRFKQQQVGDVMIFSIRTKMHVLGPGVIAGLVRAVDLAEAEGRALVIWSPSEPFSAGADLKAMLPVLMSGGPKAVGAEEAKMQQAFMRVKYAQVPVVAAIQGLALGGGCELLIHCARRVACLESYIGFVEVGVGLIPGAGGLKEGALRAAAAARAAGTDLVPFLRTWFQNAAMATVSRSALEARAMGYLLDSDTIVFNPYELLWTAIGEAFAMQAVGYRPPLRVKGFAVAGRSGAATIKSQLVNMKEGGYISDHDFLIAGAIADVMTGGDVEPGSLVDEQWLLDLERQHFIKLVAHPKSQERAMGMMQTGKPVRN
jgi:3-hydroxyacyl-CoA dehydrogenase